MAGALGDLVVALHADTASFESDLGRAARAAEREMESMATRAVAAGQLIGDAIAKAAANFAHMTAETVKLGDELSKLSQRTGQTVERLSELRLAAELSNVGAGELTSGLSAFNKALAEAQNESSKTGQTFKALGVDITAGPQKAMEQFIKAVDSLPDPEQKVAAMRIGFGRAGDALIPLIGSLDETTQRLRNLGVVMSEEAAKKSERFNDALGLLQVSSRALYQDVLLKFIEPLTTIAESMVKAKERGTSLRDGFIELGKAIIATNGTIASYIPIWGTYIEEAAQRAFNALDRLKRSGIRPIGPPPNAEQGPPRSLANPEAVACAVSGGKWENGVCVRPGPKGGAGRGPRQMSLDELLAKNATTRLKAQEDAERKAEEAADRAAADRTAEEEDALRRVTAGWVAYAEAVTNADFAQQKALADMVNGGKSYTQVLEDIQKRTDRLADQEARQLGMTFSSAFEDAVIHGKKLRDVLQGMFSDLAKLLFRKTVTEPLASGIGDAFKGSGGGFLDIFKNFFSGFKLPSFAVGTDYVPQTGLALVHQGERIIPAGENNRGGAVTVNQVVNVDSRSDIVSIQHAMAVSRQEAVAVFEDRQRRTPKR